MFLSSSLFCPSQRRLQTTRRPSGVHMATQNPDDDLVECMELPTSMQDLYAQACQEEQYLATISTPTNRRCTTMVAQGRGREVIAKVEELSLVSRVISFDVTSY